MYNEAIHSRKTLGLYYQTAAWSIALCCERYAAKQKND